MHEADEPAKLKVSVIVPVWNGAHCIERCLTALCQQSLSREDYEVIVVDNGSTDPTPELVKRYAGIRYLSDTRAGSYNARNTGLEAVRSDVVAFTDADCVPDRDWLKAGLEALAALPDAGIVAGRVSFITEGKSRFTACDDFELLFSFDQQKNAREGSSVTANWISRVSSLKEQGGFRSDLKSGGDFELSSRLHRLGKPIVYGERAVVRHPLRSDIRDLFAKTLRTSGGQLLIMGRSNWRTRVVKTVNNLRARLVKVLRTKDLPLWRRARLSVLVTTLATLSLFEIGRVALGGEARR